MPYTVPDWPVLAAFTLLAIALLAALAGQRRLALGVAVPASAVALWAGVLAPLAGLAYVLLGLAAWLCRRWPRARWPWLAAVVLILALALHALPGFYPPRWWQGILADNSKPYTLYWHWDKGLAGLWLLLCLPRVAIPAVAKRGDWLLACAACLFAALGLALASGLLAWQPKWPAWWLPWLVANLLLVSLPEEALFRQGVFAAAARWPLWQRCAISALLFGLVHVPGGLLWALVATLAGAAYALLYAATGRLGYAILLHTGFNVLHLAWLSYPQLR